MKATEYAGVWGGPWDGQQIEVRDWMLQMRVLELPRYRGEYLLVSRGDGSKQWMWAERASEA